MFNLENLLKNEYFPLELPQCFSTLNISKHSKKISGWVNSSNIKNSIPLSFSGFKNINARRKFSIPNPYHYVKAIECIVNNSNEIFKILNKSNISLSAPIDGKIDDNQPYCKKTYSVSETRKEIEKLYQDNTYQIKLDISVFFDSIYTHSIPWAMHTKQMAKKSKGNSGLIGDKIDHCMQAMNYSQTHGILVGNAVSRIVSEIILCTVDYKIQMNFKNIKCKRFVDDYYIFVKNAYEIQNIISFIRTELGKYELLLNENKISVMESPFSYGKAWIEELKLYIHLDKEVFLNKTINLFNKYKDVSILKYGIKVISFYSFAKSDWNAIESKIINLWTRYPALSYLIVDVFLSNKNLLRKNNIRNAIYTILEKNVELNNHEEVIWAVWIAKIFEIKINSSHLINIIQSQNCIAIILILDIISAPQYVKSKGLIETVNEMLDFLENEPNVLWSQYWMLAYEIDFNNWAKDYGRKFEYARNDDFFKKLVANKVDFYDRGFSYESKNNKNTSSEYLTKKEFYMYLNKLKKMIGNMAKEPENESIESVEKEFDTLKDKIYDLFERY